MMTAAVRTLAADLQNILDHDQSRHSGKLLQLIINQKNLSAIAEVNVAKHFESDLDYVKFITLLYPLYVNRSSLQANLRKRVLDARATSMFLSHSEIESLLASLNALILLLENAKREKMNLTQEVAKASPDGQCLIPRIVRLAAVYELNPTEQTLLEHVFVIQTSPMAFSDSALTPSNLMSDLGISQAEFYSFVDNSRKHVEIFADMRESRIMERAINLEYDIIRILSGCSVSNEQFLKLEGSDMSKVLSIEPKYSRLTLRRQSSGQDQKAASEAATELYKSSEEYLESITTTAKEKAKDEKENIKDQCDRAETNSDEAYIDGEIKDSPDEIFEPYTSDLTYLSDYFEYLATKVRLYYDERSLEIIGDGRFSSFENIEAHKKKIRTSKADEKLKIRKIRKRLENTSKTKWYPRLEVITMDRGLSNFEKEILILLIGTILAPNKISMGRLKSFNVGLVLSVFHPTLEEQVSHRRFFYKSGQLVKDGMITVYPAEFGVDLVDCTVGVDRRLLDYAVGLESEFSELIDGSHLYFPNVDIKSVVLPDISKNLVLETVANFKKFAKCRKELGFDDIITYGKGLVLLFFGESGTGKTMLANAVATYLEKKILLINFPSLGVMNAGENLKFIFREAKINDAILFFDECESIFMKRDQGNYGVNMLLTEIERHEGLIIMATNRAQDLDEAMQRRITLSVHFDEPDLILRRSIWESLLPKNKGLKIADDVDLMQLATKYELTGGYIKNAVLSALSIAVSRDGVEPVVRQADLEQGASLQLRGRLSLKKLERQNMSPTSGLEIVIVSPENMKVLKDIVSFSKARSVLFGQWGFGKQLTNQAGASAIFHGPPGTGKTMAALSIAFEIGKNLKVVNSAELLSKWVGETSKNIEAIFQEARAQDSVLVFDEAEGLFGRRTSTSSSSDRYANIDVGVLLYHMERHPGEVILTTNNLDDLDPAFFRRIKFFVKFEMPTATIRAQIWRGTIPKETPLDPNVDFKALGSKYELSGGSIKSAVIRAAARAAVRIPSVISSRGEAKEGDTVKVTMQDLVESAEEEVRKSEGNWNSSSLPMYM